ncbi:MAG: HAMP domain-containing histidine kinase [Planctomycetales bacterium]|nr:HAMP domain-containing histidine kinase [Planctomycetales bacterium]
MFERRSLRWPITLGVLMIVLTVALTVGWVLMSINAASSSEQPSVYWTLLAVGSAFLALILTGVVTYLTLTIKSVNLTVRQSNFIDSVTHELKSPIASLKLYLQTMNRRSVTAEKREQFLRAMLEDVERLDQLITHLLEAGRVEKENVAGDQEWVSVDGLVIEVAEAVCVRYQVPLSIIRFDLSACEVEARRMELSIILRNLLDNAVKYAGERPQVSVQATAVDERVKLTIADNGPGIPKEARRKIFGRFVRLGLELERQKPGTGLGLYIARTLVRRLRGKIRVVDNETAPGTTFEVVLPGRAAERPAAAPSTAKPLPTDEEAA